MRNLENKIEKIKSLALKEFEKNNIQEALKKALTTKKIFDLMKIGKDKFLSFYLNDLKSIKVKEIGDIFGVDQDLMEQFIDHSDKKLEAYLQGELELREFLFDVTVKKKIAGYMPGVRTQMARDGSYYKVRTTVRDVGITLKQRTAHGDGASLDSIESRRDGESQYEGRYGRYKDVDY